MPSLSEKLKALGWTVDAKDLKPAPPERKVNDLGTVLSGKEIQTSQGEAFLVEEHLAAGSPHGHSKIELRAPLEALGACLSIPSLASLPVESFLFLDTETTGLSGGTGTYTFLIGAGRFIKTEFVLEQFFLRSPAEEQAQLYAFEEFLAPCQSIVTFNGKSFDIPLLQTRFLMHGWQAPFQELIHIDLLHLSRRLWRNRLPSRTLGNLEIQILDADRTEEDVPGWLIPSLYSEYLLDGNAGRLKPVFYHNKMDVISLAVLMDHIASLLSDPISGAGAYGVDLVATARVFEQMGDLDNATRLYISAIEHQDALENRIPKEILLDALTRLATIYKRKSEFDCAVAIWQHAAHLQHLEAHIELAKYFEHQVQDIRSAIEWTLTAMQLLQNTDLGTPSANMTSFRSRYQSHEALVRRLSRLEKKSTRRV